MQHHWCLCCFYVFRACCVVAHVFGAGWFRCFANVLCLNAAWAPGGVYEAPGCPWRGSSGAARGVQNYENSLVFIMFSSFPCILRLCSCFWRLVEQNSCQPVLFEVGLGAKRVPLWSRMAPVRLQRGCLEGAKRCFCIGFYSVFMMCMHLAFWLMVVALGNVHVASDIAIVCFQLF